MIGEVTSLLIDFSSPDILSRLGFRYWKHPGPFVQYDGIAGATGRFVGWWSVVSQAAFSFIGTEIVAVSVTCAVVSRREIQIGGDRSPLGKLRILVAAYQRLFAVFTSVFCCKGRVTTLLMLH